LIEVRILLFAKSHWGGQSILLLFVMMMGLYG
jgi:hypothetical protein